MNNWNGVVRMTADPKLEYTQGGTAVASFMGAVDKYNAKKLSEEGKQSANFIPFKAFGKQAETICQYHSKGDQIGITGAIDTFSYEKDGQTRYGWNVICNQFTFISNGKSKTSNNQEDQSDFFDDPSEDIPF